MSSDIDRRLYEKNTPLIDAPAFLRRARAVEDAWTALLDRCRGRRETLLEMPRMRLARLFALASPASLLWSRLVALVRERRGEDSVGSLLAHSLAVFPLPVAGVVGQTKVSMVSLRSLVSFSNLV